MVTVWTPDAINSGGSVKLYDVDTTTYDQADTTYNGKSRAIWGSETKQTTSWSNETKSATIFTNELIT